MSQTCQCCLKEESDDRIVEQLNVVSSAGYKRAYYLCTECMKRVTTVIDSEATDNRE